MIGKTIGHYDVTGQIGAGGMGEVYRARDTDLGRDVALKVIPTELAQDPERLSRFEREARLLASLNHPNVAVVHGLEAFDGIRVLAMELIPGEDLSERIAHGPIALDEAIEVMRQVAEGLSAAHDRGIVHRDLKPANIKTTPEGVAKVLDFGLAKADPNQSGSGSLAMTQSPTITHDPTQAGMILGTAAYMSPEQARGKSVDRRADVWGFGVVFYELLTAHRLFAGETVSDTLAAVLRAEPDWAALPENTPAAIKRLLKRCLEKDPRRRLQDIGEARIIIENVQNGAVDDMAGAAVVSGGRRALSLQVMIAAVLAIVAAFVLGQLGPRILGGGDESASPQPVRRSEFRLKSAVEFANLTWSPDGERFVYFDDNGLWVRDLARFEAQPVPGAEGLYMPAWSPDGTQIIAADGNHLYRIPSAGGQRTRIATLAQDMHLFAGGVVWTDDDRIIFDRGNTGLMWLPASGGSPQEFLALAEGQEDFHHLDELPHGRGFIYVIHTPNAYNQIGLFSDGEAHVIHQDPTSIGYPVWSPTGHILFARFEETPGIWALPFSLSRLEATGQPFLVVPDADGVDVSSRGDMIYRLISQEIPSQLVWVDLDGTPIDTILTSDRIIFPDFSVSPDGRSVAVSETVKDNADVWIHDIATRNPRRLTFEDGADGSPSWSPDGKTIAYVNGESAGDMEVRVRPADGRGALRSVAKGASPMFSPDGEWIVFQRWGKSFRGDLMVVAADGSSEATVLIDDELTNRNPCFSPDGRFVAFARGDATTDIHLVSFPDAENSWQVTVDGGDLPAWSAASSNLFYYVDETVWVVDVETSPTVRIGTPRPLASGAIARPLSANVFPSADGSRVLLRHAVDPEQTRPLLRIIENWHAEFGG